MNDSTHIALLVPTVIGTPFAGGFYAGRIRVGYQTYALFVAPKADGEHSDFAWNKSSKIVEGAMSFFDGMANTQAMAKAGSELAKWALDLRIGGHQDWYLPSMDELEVLYRNLKPIKQKNYLYARSGINLSAVPPTYPYSADLPTQTSVEVFQAGGAEAFDDSWYWSSTQHAADSDYAWCQDFSDGGQSSGNKSAALRARAVRRFAI